MVWSHFIYLAPLALIALGVVVVIMKAVPDLTDKSLSTKKELLILVVLLLLGSFALYGSFFLETSYYGYFDAGTDTMDLYVPFYLNLVNSVADGSLGVWNFTYGLGVGSQNLQSWLCDPFNLILVPLTLLLGTSHLSAVLAFVQVCRIVACGILFDRLLVNYCQTPLARLVGSCLYPFCTFLIMWGQHYWIGTCLVLFTALLLVIDTLLKKWSIPRFLGVFGVSFLCVMWSPYGGFMVLLGAAFYALLRVIYFAKGVKNGFALAFRIIIPVACGCLAAGVALVPYAVYLFTETSRTSSDYTFAQKLVLFATSWTPLQWIPMIFSRFLGGSLIVTGVDIPETVLPTLELLPASNYYEILSLGFSVGALVMVLQFFHWAFTELDRKGKVLVGISAALVICFCFNNLLPALFNLFVVVAECRCSFIVAAPVCIALALGWEHRVQTGTLNKPLLVVGGLLTLAVLAWSALHAVSGKTPSVVFGVLAVASLALLAVTLRNHSQKVLLALFALLFASSVVDGFFMVNNRATSAQQDFPEAAQPNKASGTMAALAWLKDYDPSFYRVEKTYLDWDFANDSLVERYAGVSSYNSVEDGDLIDFYKSVWPDICGWGYWTFGRDPNAPELTTMLGVKYILASGPIQLDGYQLLQQVEGIFIYQNKDACLLTGKTATTTESQLRALPTVEERRAAMGSSVVVPDDQQLSVSAVQTDGALKVSDIQASQDQSTLTMQAQASQDVVACLAVPHTEGWHVVVDGQEVETFRANLGFTGFALEAGDHEIVAYYQIPGMTTGAYLSMAGILAAIAGIVVMAFFRRRQRTEV